MHNYVVIFVDPADPGESVYYVSEVNREAAKVRGLEWYCGDMPLPEGTLVSVHRTI